MSAPDIDPCAACGRANVIDGPDPTAHWITPTGSKIVAWTCSPTCAATVEAARTPRGRLTVARARTATLTK